MIGPSAGGAGGPATCWVTEVPEPSAPVSNVPGLRHPPARADPVRIPDVHAGTPGASDGLTESSEFSDEITVPSAGAEAFGAPMTTLAFVPARKFVFSVASVVPTGHPAAPTAMM